MKENLDISAASLDTVPLAALVSCSAVMGFNTPPVARMEKEPVTCSNPTRDFYGHPLISHANDIICDSQCLLALVDLDALLTIT